ncbi:hypothetical protein [Saccharothrix syringae]|nr:hypothetical protein [Saccharothrix syringae]
MRQPLSADVIQQGGFERPAAHAEVFAGLWAVQGRDTRAQADDLLPEPVG